MTVPFDRPSAALRGSLFVFDGRRTSDVPYAQLAADVARVTERLTASGIAAGSIVGILGENSYAWLVHDLAVMALGAIAVCLPVDELAATPHAELAETYELARLLVSKKIGNREGHPWVEIMSLAGPAPSSAAVIPAVHAPAARVLRDRIRGTDVCTVAFSSGTSGQLKALLLSCAGVNDVIESFATGWRLAPGDRVLVALPLSIFQQRLLICAALRADAHIALTDPPNLFRSFKALRPTVVLGPPALVEAIEKRFANEPTMRRPVKRARLRRRRFRPVHDAFGGRVRLLLTGSAPSKPSTLAFYARAELPLYQAYGMAEVGFIAWNRPGHNRALSVGRPLVPGSVTLAADGEIVVGLPHRQAVGYFGVPADVEALTFLPDGRVATGDLGRFDRDGFLYITGRKKSLILLQSGEKVHPESLEAALVAVPGVERGVVVGGGELAGLTAIIALDPACGADEEARIRADVQRAVAGLNTYGKAAAQIARVVVTRVRFTPELGLVTRNLKIDRQAVCRAYERGVFDGDRRDRGDRADRVAP